MPWVSSKALLEHVGYHDSQPSHCQMFMGDFSPSKHQLPRFVEAFVWATWYQQKTMGKVGFAFFLSILGSSFSSCGKMRSVIDVDSSMTNLQVGSWMCVSISTCPSINHIQPAPFAYSHNLPYTLPSMLWKHYGNCSAPPPAAKAFWLHPGFSGYLPCLWVNSGDISTWGLHVVDRRTLRQLFNVCFTHQFDLTQLKRLKLIIQHFGPND